MYQDAVHTWMAREEVDSGDGPQSLPRATPRHRRDNGGSEEGGDFSWVAGGKRGLLSPSYSVSAASPGSPRSRLWEDVQYHAEKPWLIGRAVPKPREAPRGEGEEQSLRGLVRCLFRK